MITDKELLEGIRLRISGKTWDEAGKAVFYTGQALKRAAQKRLFQDGRAIKGIGHLDNVRCWVRVHDISIEEFAARMGYCPQYLSRVLNGRCPMPKLFLERLKEVTGLTEEEISVYKGKKIALDGKKGFRQGHKEKDHLKHTTSGGECQWENS